MQLILSIFEILLLILTAIAIPVLNMWFDNKISKMEKSLEEKYFSKESAKFLADKIDKLGEGINTLNTFLLNHYSKE